jgi:hypothetical protein
MFLARLRPLNLVVEQSPANGSSRPMEPVLRRFLTRSRVWLASIAQSFANVSGKLRPRIGDFGSLRMCPSCGLFTSKYKASCLECGSCSTRFSQGRNRSRLQERQLRWVFLHGCPVLKVPPHSSHLVGFGRYSCRRATEIDAARGHPHHDEHLR